MDDLADGDHAGQATGRSSRRSLLAGGIGAAAAVAAAVGTSDAAEAATTEHYYPTLFTALGQLPVGTGVGTGSNLPVGADGLLLTARSTAANGLGVDWETVTPRVVVLAPNTSAVTLPWTTADVVEFATDQSGSSLAVHSETGVPADGQKMMLRVTSSGSPPPGYSWDDTFRGSIYGALPIAPSGGGLTDYFLFIWRASASCWDMIANVAGFA